MIRAFLIAVTSAAVLMLSPIPTSTAADSIRDKVVGAWKLISWESVRSNGEVLNIIMGPHPIGLIIYQPNGYMAVQGMHDPRPMFAERRAPAATSDEIKNAYFGYYAYWGTYTINEAENTVEHNLQSSLFPEEVGRRYVRTLRFDGRRLVLTTPVFKAGLLALPHDLLERAQVRDDEELFNRLTWERIE